MFVCVVIFAWENRNFYAAILENAVESKRILTARWAILFSKFVISLLLLDRVPLPKSMMSN